MIQFLALKLDIVEMAVRAAGRMAAAVEAGAWWSTRTTVQIVALIAIDFITFVLLFVGRIIVLVIWRGNELESEHRICIHLVSNSKINLRGEGGRGKLSSLWYDDYLRFLGTFLFLRTHHVTVSRLFRQLFRCSFSTARVSTMTMDLELI